MTPFTITSAQHPPCDVSDDKIFTTRTAVIVLDGASAHAPVPVSLSTYADTLGRHLRDHLDRDPEADLADTTTWLGLVAGSSPSSTVTILRRRGGQVDVLILGDNLLVLPDRAITDTRLGNSDLPERARYRRRLAGGTGFDDTTATSWRSCSAGKPPAVTGLAVTGSRKPIRLPPIRPPGKPSISIRSRGRSWTPMAPTQPCNTWESPTGPPSAPWPTRACTTS